MDFGHGACQNYGMQMALRQGMQAAFSIIILNDDFMGIPFGEQIAFAKRWRTSMAHDYQYMDLAGRSQGASEE